MATSGSGIDRTGGSRCPRRDVLRLAGALAAGLVATALPRLVDAAAAQAPVKIGIIGTGPHRRRAGRALGEGRPRARALVPQPGPPR
jgi:hypothetical protein